MKKKEALHEVIPRVSTINQEANNIDMNNLLDGFISDN